MAYIHPTWGVEIKNFNSQAEHKFYEGTTKRQMFLIIQEMSTLINPEQDWVELAEDERETLKANGIK